MELPCKKCTPEARKNCRELAFNAKGHKESLRKLGELGVECGGPRQEGKKPVCGLYRAAMMTTMNAPRDKSMQIYKALDAFEVTARLS